MPKSAKQSGRRTGQQRPASEDSKAKWTPSEKERTVLDAHFARVNAATGVAPRIKVSNGDITTVSLDHPNQPIGAALLADAFGITSLSITTELVDQLVEVSLKNGKYDEGRTNFMAAVI